MGTQPTEPGWYWYKVHDVWHMARVYRQSAVVVRFFVDIDGSTYTMSELIGQWSERLIPPTEKSNDTN